MAGALALATCVATLLMLDAAHYRAYVSYCLNQPFRLLQGNVNALVNPTEYSGQMRKVWQAERLCSALPKLRGLIGQSSTDVFGSEQVTAVFNGLNYRPRPVFQSYAAYSAPLMRLNEQFYMSKAAPEFVLFHLAPIDQRFPPLEDALLLRNLLMNYVPVATEEPFILLKSNRTEVPKMKLLREGNIRPGERVPMKDYGETDLWMEIKVEPTSLARMRQFAYKPSPLRLVLWKGNVPERTDFAAPAPMLAAGFLASPALLNDTDVLDFYNGTNVTRPSGYSLEFAPGGSRFWQETIHFRIYKIENRLGRCSLPVLSPQVVASH